MIATITKTIIFIIPSSNELGEETIGNSDSNNFNRSTEQIQDDVKNIAFSVLDDLMSDMDENGDIDSTKKVQNV